MSAAQDKDGANQAPLTAAERIRQATMKMLARHDAAMRESKIAPGDPLAPAFEQQREFIIHVGEVGVTMAEAAEAVMAVQHGLSPKAEAELVERVGRLAAMSVRVETGNLVHETLRRFTFAAVAGSVLALALVGGGSYWLGSRNSLVMLQLKPGEIAGVCKGDAVQAAPDGKGRVCAAWVRLDQATLAAPGR